MNQDIFEHIFGGGFGGNAGRSRIKGADITASVRLDFMEAAKTTKKDVQYVAVSSCDTCSGSGLKKGKTRKQCATCKGSGQVVLLYNRLLSVKVDLE